MTYASNGAIWTNRSGKVELVVREGDLAPGLARELVAEFDHFREIIIAEDATIYFRAYLRGVGIDSSGVRSI